MGANREEFLRVLEEQRFEYSRTIAGKIAGMQLLWKSICASNADCDGMQRLVRTAHGLAGSAAIFGLDGLGREARSIERELAALPAGTPSSRDAVVIGSAIAGLFAKAGIPR